MKNVAAIRLTGHEVECGWLPRICMVCGEEATCEYRKKFFWQPDWAHWCHLGGLLLFMMVLSETTKKMTVPIPLCERHRNYWFRWESLPIISVLTTFGICVVFLLLAIAIPEQRLIFLTAILAFYLLIIFEVVRRCMSWFRIGVAEISDTSITLTNVSRAFAIAKQTEQEKRSVQEAGNHNRQRAQGDVEPYRDFESSQKPE
jgi:hypothetical protein